MYCPPPPKFWVTDRLWSRDNHGGGGVKPEYTYTTRPSRKLKPEFTYTSRLSSMLTRYKEGIALQAQQSLCEAKRRNAIHVMHRNQFRWINYRTRLLANTGERSSSDCHATCTCVVSAAHNIRTYVYVI